MFSAVGHGAAGPIDLDGDGITTVSDITILVYGTIYFYQGLSRIRLASVPYDSIVDNDGLGFGFNGCDRLRAMVTATGDLLTYKSS